MQTQEDIDDSVFEDAPRRILMIPGHYDPFTDNHRKVIRRLTASIDPDVLGVVVQNTCPSGMDFNRRYGAVSAALTKMHDAVPDFTHTEEPEETINWRDLDIVLRQNCFQSFCVGSIGQNYSALVDMLVQRLALDPSKDSVIFALGPNRLEDFAASAYAKQLAKLSFVEIVTFPRNGVEPADYGYRRINLDMSHADGPEAAEYRKSIQDYVTQLDSWSNEE